ncbi:zinc finger protein weckle-like [Culicoides brevitarsis]|uniref:zinc finger protein weckle-like n=1 Tax=Culicoides brevitarsis TaxID=469753 RepID=UPI00307B531E
MIDWLKWCRLCGSEESFCAIEQGSDLMTIINRCFTILDSSSLCLCGNCYEFVANLQNFCSKVVEVDKMYKELFSGYVSHEEGLRDIRLKYGLTTKIPLESVKKESKLAENTEETEIPDKRRRSQRKIGKTTTEYPIKAEETTQLDFNSEEKFNNSDKSLDIDQEIERMIDQGTDSDNDEHGNPYEMSETGVDDAESKPKTDQKKFECEVCQKSYSRRQTLEEHVRLKHGSEQDFKFHCEICQRKFISEKKLKQHSISHLPANEKMVHPCPHCDKKFTKSVNVVAHIKAVHIGLRPFICESCGRPFQSKGALKDHQITHSDEHPWACSQCPKRFKNQARLKTHEDIHNTTSYICPHCGLALNTKRTLKMHLVVHSEEKKYKCNYCGNEFKRSKALKNHLILHTGLRPYSCPFCNKTFANGSNCRSHKKKAHPDELKALEASGLKSTVEIPRIEMLQPKKISNFEQEISNGLQMTEQHAITLPSLATIDNLPLQATTQSSLSQIQVIDMQHPIIHQQQQMTQVITQIPSTNAATYHVPVTMLSIIEHPSIETKHEPV